MSDQNIKPGRLYYGLGIIVFIIGISLAALLLLKSVRGLTETPLQVVVPGKSDIILSDSGKYTIFYEYQSVVNNKVYSTRESLPDLECALKDKATESAIALSHSSMKAEYSLGNRKGVSVWEFSIDRPGTYEFSARYPEGQEGPEVVLAIEHDFGKKLFVTIAAIFGGVAIFLISGAIAIAIIVITLLKRRKPREQLTEIRESRLSSPNPEVKGDASRDRDEEHLKLLSIFHYVVAGLTALYACIPIIHLTFGIAMLSSFFGEGFDNGGPPAVLGWIFVGIAVPLILLGWAFAICLFVAGRKLARKEHRMFCLVMAAISCLFVPFGTVLGIFTIVVLMRPSVKALFEANKGVLPMA